MRWRVEWPAAITPLGGGLERAPEGHLIDRDDVPAWQRDSAVKGVTTHRTTAAAARAIREGGVDIERSSPDARWGRGFYSSRRPDTSFGDASASVAVRLRNPLGPMDSLEVEDAVSELLDRFGTDDVRAAVLAAGYDGVVVRYPDGDEVLVVYRSDQVKVVRDGRP